MAKTANMTAVDGDVIKRSNKSVLVKVEGSEFWTSIKNVIANTEGRIIAISTRVMNEQKTVNKIESENAEWKRNGWAVESKSQIVGETEKAIQIAFTASRDGRDFEKSMWFPKSQTKIEGNQVFVKAWIFVKNAAETGCEILAHNERGELVGA